MFLTLLLTAASVGIVIPALRDTRRTSTGLGQVILITAVLAEFASLVGIIVLGVIVEQGGLTLRVLAIPALFTIMGAILLIIRRTAWWYPERFERFFDQHDPDELGIRASLALLLVFVGISVALGIEAILGAFLAGTVFGFVFRNTGTLEERLGGFSYGFFIPIFFINVGITFPLSELGDPEVLGQAAILIGIGVIAKVLPSLVLVTRGFSFRSSLAAGLLLAGQLSVIIALADFGLRLDLISSGLRAGAILLVAVTAVLSPVTFRLLAPPLPETESAEATVD
jgi:Kef-type K+ transport system membrane component KefB